MAMNVTIATDNRVPFVLSVSAETDIASLCMVLESDTGIPTAAMRILFNGQDVQGNPGATLGSLGVVDSSLLYVTRQQQAPQQQRAAAQPAQPAQAASAPLSPRNYIGMTFDDIPPNCDPRICLLYTSDAADE